MLCLSGFELYSRWVPLKRCQVVSSDGSSPGLNRQECIYTFKLLIATLRLSGSHIPNSRKV